jgi:hypothetical protein
VAVHTRTELFDDFDATTEGVTSHEFALDGVAFEIDLSATNLARLRDALRPFMTAGRRLPQTRRSAARTATGGRSDAKAKRRWWLAQRDRDDLPAFARSGRIPAAVEQAYRAAHQPPHPDR